VHRIDATEKASSSQHDPLLPVPWQIRACLLV